jgi:hypothetical protein
MEFDLECIELSGKLALQDPNYQDSDEDQDKNKEKIDNNPSDTSSLTSNIQTDNLVNELDLLNLDDAKTSKKSKPKIIELN